MKTKEFNHGGTEKHGEKLKIKGFLRASVVMIFLLTSCTSTGPAATSPPATSTAVLPLQGTSQPSPPTAAPAASTLTPTTTLTASLVPSATLSPTPAISATATAGQATPTPDTRLKPAQWKSWSVIPKLTGRGLEIYRRGLALGNDPHAFSKVADCQGIREVLLGAYDLAGYYKLSPENAGLQETIDWFAGSFNRNGMATMGGFNARAVLQPQFADPAFCLPGETPIACEYRVHRPSIVLISEEFGYDGRTTANYVQYIRAIIDFYIGKGVLPILATKADNYEGGNALNLATASLAYEYDLPLWNWWLAAQPLYNHGLDPTRPDGFHLSVDAWRVRSATALQAIDAVWRGIRATPVGADGHPPLPGQTQTPLPIQTHPPLPVSGHALFGLAQRKGEGYEYLGVYAFDPNPKAAAPLVQVLGAGWNLQAAAPDGSAIMVNRGTQLWLLPLNGGQPAMLFDNFIPRLGIGAAWLDRDTKIAVRGFPDGRSIFVQRGDGGWKAFSPSWISPIELYPSLNPGRVYSLQASPILRNYLTVHDFIFLNDPMNYPTADVWETRTEDSTSQALPGIIKPALASNGTNFAYSFLNERDRTVLAVTTLDRSKLWSPLPDGYALDYAWSNSGRTLAALLLERSDYSGRAGALRGYLLNPLTLDKTELPAMAGLSARLAWSADGRYLLVAATEPLNLRNTDFDKGYALNLYLVNAGTGTSTRLDGKISPASQEYLFATNLAWIP